MSIWTRTFWKAAAERAVKTTAQTAAALLLADRTGILDTDWTALTSAALMAGVVSVLTSIGTGAATGTGPSLTNAETLADRTTVTVSSPADAPAQVEVTPADDPDYLE